MTQPPPEGAPADERVRGVFPGGPSGLGARATRRAIRRIRSMDEVQRNAVRAWSRTAHRRRWVRGFWVVAALAVLAVALGSGLGFLSHRPPTHAFSPAQVQTEAERFVQREVNRMLLELWRMEGMEGARGRGR